MLLHANHAALCGHSRHRCCVGCVCAETLGPEYELSELANISDTWQPTKYPLGLGPKMVQALPMFHALTSCDTVSSFRWDQLHVGLLCKDLEFPSGLIDVCACAGPAIQQDDKSLNNLQPTRDCREVTYGASHC